MYQFTKRPAVAGELCVCGRQAVTVFTTDARSFGYCNETGQKIIPCPWCGSEYPHDVACDQYTLTLPVVGGES